MKKVNDHPKTIEYVNYFRTKAVDVDFFAYCDFYASDNLQEDYKRFEPNKSIDDTVRGMVILPNNEEKIIVLYESRTKLNTIIHELTHASDFIALKKVLHINENSSIKQHPFYRTFCIWSEYHAKGIEILHTQLLIYAERYPYIDPYVKLKEDIRKCIYNDIISKHGRIDENSSYHDICWLFAGIDICNAFDQDNYYDIPDEIYNNILPEYHQMHEAFLPCTNVIDLVDNFVEVFQRTANLPLKNQ